ncbi:MAG: LamG domain-containing protein, partial [Gammaproteobacteria bacterium]|nr:LamG domain-containing protein [Gammaproteobacteria bacterium]
MLGIEWGIKKKYMATKWISPTWRMPTDTESPAGTGNNQSKLDNYSSEFDGTADYINCGNPTALQITGNLSISAWVKFDNATAASDWFVAKDDNGAGSGRSYMLNRLNTGKIRFAIQRSGLKSVQSSTVLSSDTWYHVVGVNDGTDLKVYINGSLDNTTAGDGGAIDNGNSDFTLGANEIPGGYLAGSLGQVAIFDYALAATGDTNSVTALYNSGTPSNPMALSPTPIAYYPLGESSTGSSSTLTIPNESVQSATAFDFGASDYIDLGNDESLQITGAITLSMWVKMDAAGNQGFMSKSLTPYFGSGNQKYFNIGVLNPDIYWQIGNGTIGRNASYGFASYMDGNWHHVVGTFDGTLDPDNIRLYIDGVYVDASTAAFDTIKGDSVYPLCISDRTKVYDSGMEMANAQIWDSNLTDGGVAVSAVAGGEIATLYNNGTPYTGTQPQAANLQGWWKLDADNSTWDGSDW